MMAYFGSLLVGLVALAVILAVIGTLIYLWENFTGEIQAAGFVLVVAALLILFFYIVFLAIHDLGAWIIHQGTLWI